MRSAPAFQLLMIPSSVLPMIASSEDSTIAASCDCSACKAAMLACSSTDLISNTQPPVRLTRPLPTLHAGGADALCNGSGIKPSRRDLVNHFHESGQPRTALAAPNERAEANSARL